MKLSRTVTMAQEVIDDTMALTKKGLRDASEEGFKTEVFPWAVNVQIQNNLKHLKMIVNGIEEDAQLLEKRMSASKEPDDYGVDEESGKPLGRYLGVAKV